MVWESWRAQFGTINPLTIGIAAECVFFSDFWPEKIWWFEKKVVTLHTKKEP